MPDTVERSRADILNAEGVRFHTEVGRVDAARFHYIAALSLEPDHKQALQNLGASLLAMQKFEAAASVSRRASALDPSNYFARMNLAVAYTGLRNFYAALAIFDECLPLVSGEGRASMLHNYGLVKYMLGDLKGALAAFNEALAIMPNVQQILNDQALTVLSLGNIWQGLDLYECRWNTLVRCLAADRGVMEWRGECLKGKRIILYHEQGFGDSLMLVRFVGQIVSAGAIVTLAVPPELMRLFAFNFKRIKIIDWNDEINVNDYDFYSPLLSTMKWLGIEIDDVYSKPYIVDDGNDLPIKLPERQLCIGICWASGKHGAAFEQRRRVISLEKFLPLTEIPGIKLISLQKGCNEDDISILGAEGIIFDCMARTNDFMDTANVIRGLDLVISVDSAVLHLAAAMGKRTVMLSPFTRCWRWWGMDGTYNGQRNCGAPWYSNMVVFSQEQNGSWDRAMNNVTKFLQRLLHKD